MTDLFKLILGILASRFKARATLEAENLVLRQQVNVLRRRTPKRPHLNNTDRFLFVWLYRWFPSVLEAVAIVRPETIIRWHRAGFAERLIGSIRRECLDHMIVFGAADLRRILTAYAAYYNEARTHRSLSKDAPIHRAIQRFGAITSQSVLGRLHHHYCRI